MWQRCTNPKNQAWNDYGGRGIKVDQRWQKFEQFIADVGLRPGPLWSLDRIDCNGAYSPENVRWAIKSDQANNRRNTRYISAFGRTLPLAHWAEELGISYSCLEARLKKSSPEDACTRGEYRAKPVRTSRRKMITHDGVTLSHKEWGQRIGINPMLISKRLSKGYSVEEALYKGSYPNYWRKNGIGAFAELTKQKITKGEK